MTCSNVGWLFLAAGSVLGGWAFMCDALERENPMKCPGIGRGPMPVLLAVLLSLVGVIILFAAKWYLGLVGIASAVIGFNVFAAIWDTIYRMFRL